jgi:hypothetical protein
MRPTTQVVTFCHALRATFSAGREDATGEA